MLGPLCGVTAAVTIPTHLQARKKKEKKRGEKRVGFVRGNENKIKNKVLKEKSARTSE